MAATTHNINGTDYILEISEDNGASYDVVAHLTGTSVEATTETRETTTKDSGGWSEKRGALRSWSLSADGLIQFNAENDKAKWQDLYDLMKDREIIDIRLTNSNSGDYQLSGKAIITSLNFDAPMEDNITFSVSMEGTGPLAVTSIS